MRPGIVGGGSKWIVPARSPDHTYRELRASNDHDANIAEDDDDINADYMGRSDTSPSRQILHMARDYGSIAAPAESLRQASVSTRSHSRALGDSSPLVPASEVYLSNGDAVEEEAQSDRAPSGGGDIEAAATGSDQAAEVTAAQLQRTVDVDDINASFQGGVSINRIGVLLTARAREAERLRAQWANVLASSSAASVNKTHRRSTN